MDLGGISISSRIAASGYHIQRINICPEAQYITHFYRSLQKRRAAYTDTIPECTSIGIGDYHPIQASGQMSNSVSGIEIAP